MRKVGLFVLMVFGLSFFGGCASNNLNCNISNYDNKNSEIFKTEIIKDYTVGIRNTAFVGSQILRLNKANVKVVTVSTYLTNYFEANSDFSIVVPDEFKAKIARGKDLIESVKVSEKDVFNIRCVDTSSKKIQAEFTSACSFDKLRNCSYIFDLDSEGNIKGVNTDYGHFQHKIDGALAMAPYSRIIRTENKKEILAGSQASELIYNGKDGNNIKVSYREYKDDMARPAFFQDLTYNLKESDIIRYKNYKIKVHKATNEEISYTVLED